MDIWGDEEENKNENEVQKKVKQHDGDDSGDEKRKVKSPKEKLKEMIKEKYQKIKNSVNSKNFVVMHENLEELLKHADKVFQLFGDDVPLMFFESFCTIEDCIGLTKEEQKNLKRENNTAFHNIKKALLKKKNLDSYLVTYKTNRATEDELLKEEEEDEEEFSRKSSDNEAEKSEIDIYDLMKQDENKEPAQRRLKWVKKEKKETETKNKGAKPVQPTESDQPKPKVFQAKTEKVYEAEKVEEIITDDKIEKEITEISNQRGQSKSPIEAMARLKYLNTKTKNEYLKLKLTSLSISICFDTSLGQFVALNIDLWHQIHEGILSLLSSHEILRQDNLTNPNQNFESITTFLQGNLIVILEKLELELYKSLQFTDNNSTEYIERIKDEMRFLVLASKVEAFYTLNNNNFAISRIYILIIMHLYYKNEDIIKKLQGKFNLSLSKEHYLLQSIESPLLFINNLCNIIYSYSDEKAKLKAMLCQIYFLCIHNNYIPAKKLFNSSHLYELVMIFKDEQLKTLFNRTLAQLGICSFRNGKLKDVLIYLNPICSTGTNKLKEYLSQSYNKENEKNLLFDKEDKKRAIPHLMRINIDEIETVFYLSLMLLDLPNIILFKQGMKHKEYSAFFSRILSHFRKQIFNGPPETNKERVLFSSMDMIKGDWKKCLITINQIKLFNSYSNYSQLKEIITKHIKESSLKCYLVLYAKEFSSFNINILAKRFELSNNQIKKLINDMITDEELNAKWKKDILNVITVENDSMMIKRVLGNLNTITNQNLDLIQTISETKVN